MTTPAKILIGAGVTMASVIVLLYVMKRRNMFGLEESTERNRMKITI